MKILKRILLIFISILMCFSIGCGNTKIPNISNTNSKVSISLKDDTNQEVSKDKDTEVSEKKDQGNDKQVSTKEVSDNKLKDDKAVSKNNKPSEKSKDKNDINPSKENTASQGKDNIFTLIIAKESKGYTGKESEVLLKKDIEISGKKNAMTYLRENSNINEKGGFIYEINEIHNVYPIPSSEKTSEQKKLGILGKDWFIYLNDKKAQVGANDIYPKNGDVLLLDFHEWNKSELAP